MMIVLENAVSLSNEFRRLSPPIIIIGMHRSGTSLVAGLLDIFGVYVDPEMRKTERANASTSLARQSGYGEAVSFRLLNEEIMAKTGATWDNPLPFLAVRDDVAYAQSCREKIAKASRTTLKEGFLSALPPDYGGLWGWKDPRTSLTLPYWLEAFPKAKLLHVTRDAEDVAKSLMSRAQAKARKSESVPNTGLRARAERVLSDPQSLVRALQRRLSKSSQSEFPVFSMLDREDCIRLADIYVGECTRYRESGYDYSEVSYEEIIAAPEASVRKIAAMLQIETNEAAIAKAVQFISRP